MEESTHNGVTNGVIDAPVPVKKRAVNCDTSGAVVSQLANQVGVQSCHSV